MKHPPPFRCLVAFRVRGSKERRDRLAEIEKPCAFAPAKVGALVAINGALLLDLVGRPDAYAPVHAPLLQGYALDALDSDSMDGLDQPDEGTAAGEAIGAE